MISTLRRYFHTLRHLRAGQIIGRLWFQVYTPDPETGPAPALRDLRGRWWPAAARKTTMTGPNAFVFLNEAGEFSSADDWNAKVHEKLWLYNLHYFDDLNAEGADRRRQWHLSLLQRWVAENPPGTGNGWEPYPTSLRIVNWVKWAFAGNTLDTDGIHSLAVQARWLAKRMETHLLGNHLFANAKALVFAGLFFDGREAAGGIDKGSALLHRELAEQVLDDGGHFERSPMYHAIVLEDVLDLINLAGTFPGPLKDDQVQVWKETAGRMLEWLRLMCHPDGGIAFFNDAAFGVAPEFGTLRDYGERLRVSLKSTDAIRRVPLAPGGMAFSMETSGYVRVESGASVAILDLAPIGPDYLPGHAHADTLSFELSHAGRRILVNSGCSRYGSGVERLRQRGTPAHNTVSVNGADSSDVWGGFRVGCRAHPFDKGIHATAVGVEVSCAHDGYRHLPGRPVHRRLWSFYPEGISVRDRVEGTFSHSVANYHFHPDAKVTLKGSLARVEVRGAEIARINVKNGDPVLVEGSYHPGFGLSVPNQLLQVHLRGSVCEIEFLWG